MDITSYILGKKAGGGGGGDEPTGTKEISITANGTTTENVKDYASAKINVNVTNSYAVSDEGKVVSNGALVAQSSATYTANDTYDTTLVDEVTVNVSGSGSEKTLTNILGNSTTYITGYWSSSGSITAAGASTKEVTTDYIDIGQYAGQDVQLWTDLPLTTTGWAACRFYKSDYSSTGSSRVIILDDSGSGHFTSNVLGIEYVADIGTRYAGKVVTIPSDAKYIRVSFRTGGNARVAMTTDISAYKDYFRTRSIPNLAYINPLESDGTAT